MKNHTFISARFTDDDKTIIEAAWQDNADENIVRTSTFEKIEGSVEWEELMSLMTEEELHENTVRYMRQERQQFEEMVMQIAQQEGLATELSEDDLVEKIVELVEKTEDETDEQALFKFKLSLFDKPIVKDSTNRELKAEIRKSKTYIDSIIAYRKFYLDT